MRKIILGLFISIIALGLLVTEAEAARFGGGRSFGMSRMTHTNSAFNAGNPSRSFQSAPGSGASKWLGPLAGFAAGGLLASLFMGHGFGSGILSWLMLGGLAFLVWRFIKNRLPPASQPAASPHIYQYQPAATASSFTSAGTLANFDEAAFLRRAKTVFIRLQADYDNKNLNDIREFATPEVFAEIQLQLQERGDAPNYTEVVSINAALQDTTTENTTMIASVLFSGLVREEPTSAPVAINELWHFSKSVNSQDWLVAGIQQQ